MSDILIIHITSLAAMGLVCFVFGRLTASSKLKDACALAEVTARRDRVVAAMLTEIEAKRGPVFTIAEVHLQQLLAFIAIATFAIRMRLKGKPTPPPEPQYRRRVPKPQDWDHLDRSSWPNATVGSPS